MGNGAGPSKVKKIEDLRAKGHDIRIIYEPELVQILRD
jgi:BRCT domain type II-containing protein